MWNVALKSECGFYFPVTIVLFQLVKKIMEESLVARHVFHILVRYFTMVRRLQLPQPLQNIRTNRMSAWSLILRLLYSALKSIYKKKKF